MPFEVYVHVPFCLRRCGYCDFNTYTARDLGEGASRKGYADVVIREMRLVKKWQEYHGIFEPKAQSVFFGGGTPTVLKAQDLVRILQEIRNLWGIMPGAEVTTEANPDTADESYIETLAEGGFTRISFGMQSAVPHVLKTLDRTHTPENVERGVKAANACGLRSSVDLIYGAPGESLDDWRKSVEMALSLGVNHVSAYALTVEPRTKMGRQIAAGTIHAPDDDDEAAKYEVADELFNSAGLEWYEISNWSRPGFESQHNLGYWKNIDWAGIGPGAHSHYNSANGLSKQSMDDCAVLADSSKFYNLRSWDILHPKRWAQAINVGNVPWQNYECINSEDALIEEVMLGLRIKEGLSIDELCTKMRKANREFDDSYLQKVLIEVCKEGLAVLHENRIIATRKGRLLNDLLIERIVDACQNGLVMR
ncbi:radical SAM family heme chaperone HemW [Gardnerella vaginalis]|uniref:Heme chaperone HemW n=1 Tax=Gardnerella vaginalis JCP8108 TaxID=1261066 RepID=S4GUV6_GARVA|nr:radical SAM family heme chaperone HemW [Gardnerella vaginalis]EPI49411.1 putative oxygen-independent coproporphyrinogen III oxidase [Gardnerella vaginalis JCP8108]